MSDNIYRVFDALDRRIKGLSAEQTRIGFAPSEAAADKAAARARLAVTSARRQGSQANVTALVSLVDAYEAAVNRMRQGK